LATKKEYIIKMNTGSSSDSQAFEGFSINEFETSIIKGNLNGLIIDSPDRISITINSSLGYLIFHNGQTRGINYYAPRAVLQGHTTHIAVADQFDKFKLNERLNIRISGPANQEVTIIIRID